MWWFSCYWLESWSKRHTIYYLNSIQFVKSIWLCKYWLRPNLHPHVLWCKWTRKSYESHGMFLDGHHSHRQLQSTSLQLFRLGQLDFVFEHRQKNSHISKWTKHLNLNGRFFNEWIKTREQTMIHSRFFTLEWRNNVKIDWCWL